MAVKNQESIFDKHKTFNCLLSVRAGSTPPYFPFPHAEIRNYLYSLHGAGNRENNSHVICDRDV